MKTEFTAGGLDCLCCRAESPEKIAYVLYPMELPADWIEPASKKYGTTISVVTGMDWDNVFSPWPAPGEPPGSPDFQGHSASFLQLLRQTVLPEVESRLSIPAGVERTLVGVSMSGLFALWQWMECDTFANIGSLSGSFWYPGLVSWMKSRPIPQKSGKGYFLLGNQESKSPVKAFRPVGENTQEILSLLKGKGIDVEFESVPGNHFADPMPRLDRAFAALFPS